MKNSIKDYPSTILYKGKDLKHNFLKIMISLSKNRRDASTWKEDSNQQEL